VTKDSIASAAGKPMEMRPWQSALLGRILARRKDGRLRHRQALIGVARKNGKSALAAGIALAGLVLGPDGGEVYCLDPATRVLCDDLVWRPVGQVVEGDGLMGFDEEPPAEGVYRKIRHATVTSAGRVVQPAYRLTFEDGRQVVASTTHRWLGRLGNVMTWLDTWALEPGMRIRDLGVPWEIDETRGGGYLAGIFDGEGCVVGGQGGSYRHGSVASFAQKPGLVYEEAVRLLKERGFNLKIRPQNASGCMEAKIVGLYECMRLVGSLQPHRLVAKVPRWMDGQTPNKTGYATVSRVEYLGKRRLVAIGTTTKTLFAEGMFSHNSCAADREQARIVFGTARRMVELDPELSGLLKLYRDAIEYRKTGSVYRVLSAESYTKEGLNPHLVVFDEVHAQPNRELWDVMSLAMGARVEPLLLGITTAGVKTDSSGKDSLCYGLYQYGQRVASGEVKDESFFMAWWEPAIASVDHREPSSWPAGNPALGDLVAVEDFASTVLRTPEHSFRTKRLNQWVSVAEAWLPPGAFESCADRERTLEPGDDVALAVDGSYNNDSTAIVVATMEAKPHLAVGGLWERLPDDAVDWTVDIMEVEARIRELASVYNVSGIYFDPFRWARSMQVLEDEGLPVVAFPQSGSRMVPATARFYEAAVNGLLTHDGNAALIRHVANCRVKASAAGLMVTKDAKTSSRKIDLAVTAIMAFDRASIPEEADIGAQAF